MGTPLLAPIPSNDTIFGIKSIDNGACNKEVAVVLANVECVEVMTPVVYEVHFRSGYRITTDKSNGDALIAKIASL